MKKLLLIAIVALGLGSCKKNEVKPETAKNCKCGTVNRREHFSGPQGQSNVRVFLINICDRTESVKIYTATQALNIRIGDQICD